jgi:hypothetical protein
MTQYSDAGVEELLRELPEVCDQLQRATEQALRQSKFTDHERATEYLRSGVGRRLRVLHRAFSKMFDLFPVSTVQPIDRDNLDDAQINLHAFIIICMGCSTTWRGHSCCTTTCCRKSEAARTSGSSCQIQRDSFPRPFALSQAMLR